MGIISALGISAAEQQCSSRNTEDISPFILSCHASKLWRNRAQVKPSFLAVSGPKASPRCTALSQGVTFELLSLALLAAAYTIIPAAAPVHACSEFTTHLDL